MNGMLGGAVMTMHVTPEPGFSYASSEFHGFPASRICPAKMAAAVADIFQPARFVVTCSSATTHAQWAAQDLCVPGYFCSDTEEHSLPTGGCVRFYSLVASDKCTEDALSRPRSPGDLQLQGQDGMSGSEMDA